MSLKDVFKTLVFLFMGMHWSYLSAQIYPTNFLLNGCNYTYSNSYIDHTDTITCLDTTYHLAFEDNFNGSALDTSYWQKYYPWGRSLYDKESGTGYEKQYYSDSNVYLQSGCLHITTCISPSSRDVYDIPEYNPSWLPPHNSVYFKYTSGMLFSKPKFAAGKFEIRAKIPYIDGVWPAFWLFGDCGQEVDAFELRNTENTSDAGEDSKDIVISYHKKQTCNTGNQCDNSFRLSTGKQLSDDFHLYSVEWNSNKIIWRLDSTVIREVYRIWNISPPPPLGPLYGYALPVKHCNEFMPETNYAIFDAFPDEKNQMNIIINTAVAFDRGSYPKEFIIDYCKVYIPDKRSETFLSQPSLGNLYPNPTTGKLTVSSFNENNPVIGLIICDAFGATILSSGITNGRGDIDLSAFSKGIYIARVLYKDGSEFKKIIHN
jgi:beta-glucanase (GH16 family)